MLDLNEESVDIVALLREIEQEEVAVPGIAELVEDLDEVSPPFFDVVSQSVPILPTESWEEMEAKFLKEVEAACVVEVNESLPVESNVEDLEMKDDGAFMDGLEHVDGDIMMLMKRGEISRDEILAAIGEENRQLGSVYTRFVPWFVL